MLCIAVSLYIVPVLQLIGLKLFTTWCEGR